MVESIASAIELAIKNCFINFFKWVLGGLVSCSYWVCLFICMISLIFYITGSRKAGRWASFSFVAHILIQSVGKMLL